MLIQWMDSERQFLPSPVPDSQILSRQSFAKFGSEDCLLLNPSMSKHLELGCSLVLIPPGKARSALGQGEGFSLAILVSEIRELECWQLWLVSTTLTKLATPECST